MSSIIDKHAYTCQLQAAVHFKQCLAASSQQLSSSAVNSVQFNKAAAFLNNNRSQWHTFVTISLHRDQLIGCADEVLHWTVNL
jgi:hypothetical protein